MSRHRRARYTLARVVLATSITVTVILSTGLAGYIAWAIHPLLPFGSVGGWVAWVAITSYLIFVLDISLKGILK